MGNALNKSSPSASNKHTVLNNSQTSEALGEKSLLNATDENGGNTMLVNDPRSPTEGINRTPIQISRGKSLFRGMFSGKRPSQPELAEYTANVNKVANNMEDPESSKSNSNSLLDETNKGNVELSEKTEDAISLEDQSNEADDGEGAFILVDNKKKKKKRAKEEAKAKALENTENQLAGDNLVVDAKQVPKVHSESKLADMDSENKPRSSENEAPTTLRAKVEKAARSLTNLSSKSKGISVNQKAMNEAKLDCEDTTGTSAPADTSSSPLIDLTEGSNKYVQLVNAE